MEKTFTKKRNILIISLICTALWGSAFPALKISYDKLALEPTDIYSRIYLAGIRFFIASFLVFIYGKFIFKVNVNFERGYIKPIVILGLLQTGLQYFFFYIGIANTTGIKSAIIQASGTFFVVIAAHFLYDNDRINKRKIISLLLGFSGILVININKGFDLNLKFIGEGFLLISALVSAIATIYVKNISNKINSIILTGGQMFAGSLPLLLIGKIGMKGSRLAFDSSSLLLLFYTAFLSATAFVLWYILLKYNKAGEIAIYRLFIPIFGSILSVMFIKNETFTLNLFIGLILVVLGIIVLNLKKE